MGKRLGILGAVTAAVALVLGVALPAAVSSGRGAGHRTFRVTTTTELSQIHVRPAVSANPTGILTFDLQD